MQFDLADTVKIKTDSIQQQKECLLKEAYCSQYCLDNRCVNYCLNQERPTLIICSYTMMGPGPTIYKFDECDKCQSQDCCVGASDTNFVRASTVLVERIKDGI